MTAAAVIADAPVQGYPAPAGYAVPPGYGHPGNGSPDYTLPPAPLPYGYGPLPPGYGPPLGYGPPFGYGGFPVGYGGYPMGYGAPAPDYGGYGGYLPPSAQIDPVAGPPTAGLSNGVAAAPANPTVTKAPPAAEPPRPAAPATAAATPPATIGQAGAVPVYAIFVYRLPSGPDAPSVPLPQLALVLPSSASESLAPNAQPQLAQPLVAQPLTAQAQYPPAPAARAVVDSAGSPPPVIPLAFSPRSSRTDYDQMSKPAASAGPSGSDPAAARASSQPDEQQARASRRMWIALASLMAIGIIIVIALIATS